MEKEYRDLLTIITISLEWHSKSEMGYVMIMELLLDEPERFYMAKLPPEKYRGENMMKYYRNILN